MRTKMTYVKHFTFKFYVLMLLFVLPMNYAYSQYADEYNSGMVFKMNEDGSKYTRAMLWGQAWFQDYEGRNPNDGFSVKRARILMYSQLNDRFFILTHFGVNGINANNLTPDGKTTDVTFFLNEMFLQYKVNQYLNIGGGLSNWGGISRLNGQGSINMLTLDNNRNSTVTSGLSDQLGSQLGIFFNGVVGKVNYRFTIADALVNTLDTNTPLPLQPNEEKYLGRKLLDKGKYVFAGYVDYQFLEKENLSLPYRVGTYLGSKKVFNVGAGFFTHADAIVKANENGELSTYGVTHLNVDAFYDSPIGNNNAAITAYAQFQNSKMGDNYVYQTAVGNGNTFYTHVGYLIAKDVKDEKERLRNRWQPYVAYSHRNFTALPKVAQDIKVGVNFYLDGHNAKITAEYLNSPNLPKNNQNVFTLQAMILL
ncbi:hypothetical protein K5I29_12410 [Flavobacterium agricola]|uniref:Short chain amide porin n=1 Tax=Flavobacterium agricola TaxID=2870839 RepID=A0ABY6M296_9FLAO|nr:hypothetical protein [Flavobacterium agricola]UYW01236.1 hypothetical protein K5I29_12410 [Flavobacterium agricola]